VGARDSTTEGSRLGAFDVERELALEVEWCERFGTLFAVSSYRDGDVLLADITEAWPCEDGVFSLL
jgi:hypothetical protein